MIEKEPLHHLSQVKRAIAVVSGKGGVGKSLVTSLMAVSAQRVGLKTAILDADITGPSIPKVFGLKQKARGNELGMYPVKTRTGIDVMSVNLLLTNETDPVIWRGPIIAGTVKQFWQEVIWEDIDIMFIDMPPGTGDVPLTVFQSLKIDGIIIVTSPQDLVSMVVEKALNMAVKLQVPVLGIVENMAYFECGTCQTQHRIFGESKLDAIAQQRQVPIINRLPITLGVSELCDKGMVESIDNAWFEDWVSSNIPK